MSRFSTQNLQILQASWDALYKSSDNTDTTDDDNENFPLQYTFQLTFTVWTH